MATNVLRYLGFKKETGGYGVDPGGADFHLDIASASLDSPGEPFITYEGGIGRMPARVIPGIYVPSGGAEFPVEVTSLAYLFYLLLGQNSTDDSTVTPVTGEAFTTLAGETTKKVTLTNPKVNMGTLVLDDIAQVAHDDGFGKIAEDALSGVTGWIDYGAGLVYFTGLTPLTNYTMDYDYGWFEHTLTPVTGNTMPSFVAALGKDIFEHRFLGCVLNQLDMSMEQELINLSLDIQGQIDKKAALVALDALKLNICHGERPRAFHDAQLKIADFGSVLGDISAKVRALNLSVVNNATTEENVGLNSRFPYDGTAGALDITGTMTLQFEDTSYKEDFWGAATEPDPENVQLKAMELTIDSANWGKSIISLGKVLLQSVNIQPSGREKLMQEVSFKALYDCDSEEIIKAVISNLNNWHE